MFFRYNRRYNLLDVRDDFAHLQSIYDNGDLEFRFFYLVAPQDALVHEALTVNVSVLAKTIKQKPLLENTHTGHIDTRKLVNNVLRQVPNAKSAARQRDEFSVVSRVSDISSKINNETIGQLRAKVPAKNIQQMVKPILKLVQSSDIKELGDVKPILTQIAHNSIANIDIIHSASIDENPTHLMHDMLVRQGLDPSYITQLTHRSIPSVDTIGGILRPSKAQEVENSSVTKLLNFHLFPPITHDRPALTSHVKDGEVVHVLQHEPETLVEVSTTIVIPRHVLRLDGAANFNFFVKFELINGRTGVAVDTVVKSLDISRHTQLHYTPSRAPIVKVSKSDIRSYANLEIKQVDSAAGGIQIYKKNVYRASVDVDDYSLVGTYDLKHNEQPLLVKVDMPQNSVIIYRVVPVGKQGTQGFEYTNVVVKPGRYRQTNSLSLVTQLIDTGIKLEVRNIPKSVVAIELKARNKTTFEKEYRSVGDSIMLIDDNVRSADYFTIVDHEVLQNNIYEYAAKLVYGNGTDDIVGHAITEYIQPLVGKVDTKIDNVVVTYGTEPNVTFNIVTTIIDTHIDVVKNMLQRQDIYDMFKNDVLKEREFIKNLIAHNIQRVNLTTGERSDFGVIDSLSFSDADFRKNQAIGPLKFGQQYRYEVFALLRAPETMFETLSKEKVDLSTKKTYSFSPAKFLHPLALNRGVLMTSQGLRTRYSKEAMSHGVIGAAETVDVSFTNVSAQIVDAAASRFDKFFNVITWKVTGQIDQIDHFIIMKNVHGVRNIIGKAHSEFLYGNCQYLHPISRRDEGSFSYVIVPIFNNYKAGEQAETNLVVVEPFPSYIRFLRK